MTENKQAHTHTHTSITGTRIKTNKQNTKHVLEEKHVTRRDVPKNWQSRALHLVKGNTTLEEGKIGGYDFVVQRASWAGMAIADVAPCSPQGAGK